MKNEDKCETQVKILNMCNNEHELCNVHGLIHLKKLNFISETITFIKQH